MADKSLTKDQILEQIEKLVHENNMKMILLLESEDDHDTHICFGVRPSGVAMLLKDLGEQLTNQALAVELEDMIKKEKETKRKTENN